MQDNSKEIVISLKNVSKSYMLRKNRPNTLREYIMDLFRGKSKVNKLLALSNVNLEVMKGETIGVIGSNGSGKSTLLNIMMESIRPDKGGVVKTKGRILRLSLGMGMDPNLSARDNIYVNGSVLGLSFKKIGMIFNELIEFAGIEKYVDVPVKFFSKGMMAKLKFSIAMYANADVFLLDEFFGGVGDEDFKRKSNRMFKQSILKGHTIVIVSHNLKIIKKHCGRAIWLDQGVVQRIGPAEEVVDEYKQVFGSKKGKK